MIRKKGKRNIKEKKEVEKGRKQKQRSFLRKKKNGRTEEDKKENTSVPREKVN